MTLATFRPRVLVYEDELERIGRHVADRRYLETGGELFGLMTPSGSMVLHLTTGPGPGARHEQYSFHQDRSFLRSLFSLANDRHALQHLGTWHSHHGLSLAEPSGGDDASMMSALEASGLPAFLLVIANLVDDRGKPDHQGLPEVRAFLYRKAEPQSPVRCEWLVLPGASPLRVVDEAIARADTSPRTAWIATRVVPQATALGRLSPVCAVPTEMPVAESADAPGTAPDSKLVHALRNAPWALTDTGTAFVSEVFDALEATGMRPNEVGMLSLELSCGAVLILGEMEDDERLAAALVVEQHGETVIDDITGSPGDLVTRVRACLARAKNSQGLQSGVEQPERLVPRVTSL